MRLLPLFVVVALSAPAVAQGRLESLADRLSQTASSLASEGYRGFVDRDRGNRKDVEALFLTQQFSAGAALLQQLVRDRRPDSELRDSVVILADQARSSTTFGFGQRSWRDITGTLDEMARELNAGGSRGNIGVQRQADRISGRMRWRGRIDDRTQIYVQGSGATAKVVSGSVPSNAVFNFTSPLPSRPVTVQVNKVKGRGSIDVVQQPSRSNGFTAVVEIFDSKGGSDEYEFELVW